MKRVSLGMGGFGIGEQTYRYPGLAWCLRCLALNVKYEAQTVGLDTKFSIWATFSQVATSHTRGIISLYYLD